MLREQNKTVPHTKKEPFYSALVILDCSDAVECSTVLQCNVLLSGMCCMALCDMVTLNLISLDWFSFFN